MTVNTANPLLSVVLCTYNPRADHLQRCLDGVKAQTLSKDLWEFVVVDNNSQPPLRVSIRHTADGIRPEGDRETGVGPSGSENLPVGEGQESGDSKGNDSREKAQEGGAVEYAANSTGQGDLKLTNLKHNTPELELGWHPDARLVVEMEQGLSHARRRGFEEAKGDLIVNLDDDAVLDADYLEKVCEIAAKHPFIGVFGGQMRGEFEEPPQWPVGEYYGAERLFAADLWSNDPEHGASMPVGVGSVVRRTVADAYVHKIKTDPRWSVLGRTADKLLSCEDLEIAMTACDLGLAHGVFPALSLTHLIPKKRMTLDFLCRNAHGNGYSFTIHNYLRFGRLPPAVSWIGRINRIYRLSRMPTRQRRQELAKDRGIREAHNYIKANLR